MESLNLSERRGGNCLVAAFERQYAVLRDPSAAPQKRLEALKYVVHLAGDGTQPLHAGWAQDKGGNRYQVWFDGRGTNLHRIFDSALLEAYGAWRGEYASRLIEASYAPGFAPGKQDPVGWAEASCRIVAAPGFYPPRRVPAGYAAAMQATVDGQLITGGVNLAAVLNGVWY